MPGKVQMFDPVKNRVVSVSPEEVATREADGFTLETTESAAQREYSSRAGAGQALLATAEGAASGLTLGISDIAASELLGDSYRQERQLRDQKFGGLHTLGEIAGTVAPALLSGGTSAAAKVAAYSPAGLLTRAATAAERGAASMLARATGGAAERGIVRSALERAVGMGVSGAVEGAGFGAGQALSEAAIADQLGGFDDAAELAWAGAKQGALFGAVGGAALGGAVGAGQAAFGKLAKRFARSSDELAGAANERALKAIDPRGTEVRKLGGEAKVQQVGEDLRSYVLQDGRAVIEAGEKVDDIAPKIRAAKEEVTAELEALRSKVAAVPAPVNALGYITRVDDEVLQPLLKSPSPSIRSFGRRVQGELESLASRVGRGEEITYADLLAQQRALKDVAYPKRAPGQGLPTAPAEWTAHLAKTERILEDELEGHVTKVLGEISPDDVGRYVQARRLSESFIKADKIATKAVGQNLGNRAISLTDYLTGMGAAGAVFDGGMSALGGLTVTAAHKLARERGSSLLASLYTRANSVNGRIENTVAQVFAKRAPAQLPALTKIKSLTQSVAPARRAVVGVAAGESAAFDTHRLLAAERDEKPGEAYQRILASAKHVANGGAVEMNIDEAAPQVGHAMRLVQQRAAQHLVRTAPTPLKQNTNPNLGRMTRDRDPDPVALYQWARRVRAIQDPASVLEDVADNRVSVAAVEAVREVYPKLYQKMRIHVLDKLGDTSELVSYETRIKLGLVFQLPTDATLEPSAIGAMQAVYAAQPTPQKQQAQAAGVVARNMKSGSEKIEEL